MSIPVKNNDSDIIRFIRFPLIAWVVLLHSVLCSASELLSNGYRISSYIIEFLQIGIRTPLFFFISGYCFFNNVQSFDIHTYLSKLKSRCHTLLIPYLIWNLVVIIYFLCLHTFFPGFVNPENEDVSAYSLLDFFRAFWDKSGGQPIAYQLWFLRDLMVVCIATPVIYFLCKKLKLIGALSVLALYLSDIWIPFKCALVFFFLGAYFSVNKKSFSNIATIFARWGGVYICTITVVFSILFPEIQILRKICILLFALTFTFFISSLVSKGHTMIKLFSDSNYFIYLWHGFPVLVFKYLYIKIFSPSSGIEYLAGTFIVWAITVLVALTLYYLLDRYLPKTTAVLLGRKKKS